MKTPTRIIKWQKDNQEKVKETKQSWYQKNKERILKEQKIYRKESAEIISLRRKEERKKNITHHRFWNFVFANFLPCNCYIYLSDHC